MFCWSVLRLQSFCKVLKVPTQKVISKHVITGYKVEAVLYTVAICQYMKYEDNKIMINDESASPRLETST